MKDRIESSDLKSSIEPVDASTGEKGRSENETNCIDLVGGETTDRKDRKGNNIIELRGESGKEVVLRTQEINLPLKRFILSRSLRRLEGVSGVEPGSVLAFRSTSSLR